MHDAAARLAQRAQNLWDVSSRLYTQQLVTFKSVKRPSFNAIISAPKLRLVKAAINLGIAFQSSRSMHGCCSFYITAWDEIWSVAAPAQGNGTADL
ncbi:MAG: hypothetical protein J2P21_30055 [Chloracidobacterium sp.]|nr:hypothetical protein [Chloracidobacterium sp.]